MKKRQTIAIVHYNTPELTEACIMSIRKTGCQWPVVVFDNSDILKAWRAVSTTSKDSSSTSTNCLPRTPQSAGTWPN